MTLCMLVRLHIKHKTIFITQSRYIFSHDSTPNCHLQKLFGNTHSTKYFSSDWRNIRRQPVTVAFCFSQNSSKGTVCFSHFSATQLEFSRSFCTNKKIPKPSEGSTLKVSYIEWSFKLVIIFVIELNIHTFIYTQTSLNSISICSMFYSCIFLVLIYVFVYRLRTSTLFRIFLRFPGLSSAQWLGI